MSKGSFDKYITVFSPEGALYQVEYAFKAVNQPGLTTVAIRGKEGVVVATQHRIPDKLIKSESITNMHHITKSIGCCTTGRAPDGMAFVQESRQIANDYKYKFGVEIPCSVLAKRVADKAQVSTQEMGMRPYGVSMIFIGMECDDNGTVAPEIFKVDPAGFYAGYFATATGAKESEGIAFLEKREKRTPFNTLSNDEISVIALHAIQAIAGASLKAKDVELACCTLSNKSFRVVSHDEVEGYFSKIADEDN
eukprot:Tbor_TRINITY_DN2086_c0_g1::TRINITY_DN2086_c0_g1_i2::g.12117::m.12117/K02730/PSMA6; 20S proteasome subunit alpha 1